MIGRFGASLLQSDDWLFLADLQQCSWRAFLCVRIERLLKEIGWKKQPDKFSDDFKLKWVEVKSAINYDSLREGQYCKLYLLVLY